MVLSAGPTSTPTAQRAPPARNGAVAAPVSRLDARHADGCEPAAEDVRGRVRSSRTGRWPRGGSAGDGARTRAGAGWCSLSTTLCTRAWSLPPNPLSLVALETDSYTLFFTRQHGRLYVTFERASKRNRFSWKADGRVSASRPNGFRLFCPRLLFPFSHTQTHTHTLGRSMIRLDEVCSCEVYTPAELTIDQAMTAARLPPPDPVSSGTRARRRR